MAVGPRIATCCRFACRLLGSVKFSSRTGFTPCHFTDRALQRKCADDLRIEDLESVTMSISLKDSQAPMDRVLEEVREALSSKDWDALLSTMGSHWTVLLRTFRATMREALDAVPDDVLRANPRWLAARDYVNYTPDAGPVRPVRFEHNARNSHSLMDTLAVLTSQSAAARIEGHFPPAVAAAREALQELAGAQEASLAQLRPVLADMRNQWAISLLLGGELREASNEFETSYTEALAYGNTRMAVEAAGSIAFISALTGNVIDVDLWLRRRPSLNVGDAPDTIHVMGHLAEALAAVDALDPDRATTVLAQLPADDVAPEQWALRQLVEARLAARFGDPLAQLIRLRNARNRRPSHTSQHGINQWAVLFSEATLLLATGTLEGLPAMVDTLARTRADVAEETASVLRVWMLVRAGADADALDGSIRALATASAFRTHAELLAASAVAHLHSGHPAQATQLFQTCLTIVHDQHLYAVLTRLEDDELETLLGSSQSELDPDLSQRRTRSNRLMPPRPPVVDLTGRERVVLRLLLTDRTSEQIATLESVSRNTIKSQTRSLFQKLGVSTREEAVRLARKHPALWVDVPGHSTRAT